MDALADRIKELIFYRNLVDIFPSTLTPTWDNGRSGDGYVAKQFDHFLLHEQIDERLGMVHSKEVCNHISDHPHIVLH